MMVNRSTGMLHPLRFIRYLFPWTVHVECLIVLIGVDRKPWYERVWFEKVYNLFIVTGVRGDIMSSIVLLNGRAIFVFSWIISAILGG